MDELLLKAIGDLSEEEWKQVQQFKNKKKIPSIPFTNATLQDCIRPDGLSLDLRFIEPYWRSPAPTLHIPPEIAPLPVPSTFLCSHLRDLKRFFVMSSERACRKLIDAILTEVLVNESEGKLFGFCHVENGWEGSGLGYTGHADFMLGSSRTKSVETLDSMLLIMQAKNEWPDSAVPLVIAEAGCLLKKRLAAGKNTPVFAVLSNGSLFRFFAIDTDGVVYASELVILKLGEDDTYNSSTSLSEILRWFSWFMTVIKSVSPSASSKDLTAESIADSIAKLRNGCFGPKHPISSSSPNKDPVK